MKSFLILIIASSTFFLFLIINNSVCAETWEQTYGGSESDSAECIQTTNDGGYIITGQTYSSGAGEWDAWVIKTDSKGKIVWDKTYGGTDVDWGSWGQQTVDNGYIFVGSQYIADGNPDGFLIKTDRNGNVEWNKTYGGTNYEYLYMVQETTDGYVMCGSTSSVDPERGYWLVKTDKNGSIVWDKIYNDPRPGNQGESLEEVGQTADGGYVMFGITDTSDGDYQDVIKADASGKRQWWKRYACNVGEICPWTAIPTSDGNIAIGGAKKISQSPYVLQLFIAKLDLSGNTLWTKLYDYAGGVRAMIETADGGFALLFRGENKYPNSDIRIIKTDSNGNTIWTKVFIEEGNPESITESADGGFAFLARSETGPPTYDSNIKIIYYKRPEGKGMNPAIPALLLSD